MKHFDIVLAISRIAMDGDSVRASHQIERLKKALGAEDAEQAAKLGRLLSRNERRHAMAPMAFEEMRATAESARRQLPGEALTPTAPLPTDRETGTPLARVIFPSEKTLDGPILNESLASAIDDLLAEWTRTQELALLGTKPNMRCLIYGPPGVGKTKLARYLARQLDLPCVEARLDGITSSFLGTTARNIGSLFEFADRYRCVLFLDEFDAVAKARDDVQEIGEIKRVVNTLLQSLDARNGNGITLAATNHEHLLDPAVWRRFDNRIQIQLPDVIARRKILETYLSPVRLTVAEMKFLLWATEGMSGADLENLVQAGKRYLVLHAPEMINEDSSSLKTHSGRGRILLDALRREATLNARAFRHEQHDALTGPEGLLDQALTKAGLNQTEAGAILGITQSAMSRRIKKPESNSTK